MGKQPSIQFYTGDWLKDPSLSRCSPATRGIWMDAICAMHEAARSGKLSGTADQLSRVLRCSPTQVRHAASELRANGAADVEECNGVVTLVNRRMQREYEERLAIKRRVRKHRGNADETPNVTPPSSSSSSTSDPPIGGPPPPPRAEDVPIPTKLDTPEFRAVWAEFVGHRREMGKKLTPRAAKSQLDRMEAWGVHRAIAATRYSIAGGWQGIFEEKRNGAHDTKPQQRGISEGLTL